MNGVTGRMGTNQHLLRSIMAIREQGGVVLEPGKVLFPEPILVGRNEAKLRLLAEQTGLEKWSTNLEKCLDDSQYSIYFDAGMTHLRPQNVRMAIAAGKHIYTEKPSATTAEEALELARLAKVAGVKTGVVQDKLFLPGLLKLKRLIDGGFFGRILSVRGEFGYWVFEGDWQTAQRPSWNYRAEDGGGITLDMVCHWRYVLSNLFGDIKSLTCTGATHIPQRWDENDERYQATADDAAYATFELANGVIAQINSSWCVRVNRDELVEFQIDGTEGSAVAGLHGCKIQHRSNTPKPVWNPDEKVDHHFADEWQEVPDNAVFDNGFKTQWEMFLRHVAVDEPYKYDLLEGAKGVQLAELALQSWKEKRWVDVPELVI